MTTKKARLESLIRILQLEGSLKITEISERLGVSPMTTRRDLEFLSNQGEVKVLYGAVIFTGDEAKGSLSDYLLAVAESQNKEKKKRIAQYAASLVEDNDIIFLDGGSTTELLAQFIPSEFHVTVVCCSINVFLTIANKKNIDVILIGGMYNRKTMILEQSMDSEILRNNRIRKAFISAGGVHEKLGVTCANQSECVIKKTAMESSLEKILVVDSTKFGFVHSCYFAGMEEFDLILTDNSLQEKHRKFLQDKETVLQVI
ncbi:MAG: DeoR/GlpR transcriptional regulator [Sphaerochaeta sp.]|nr:DeoR/GlpR transcriptional regulator [Sphaerochaeta sp.]